MSGRNVAIVIPSYKRTLDVNERISLAQCRSVLGDYDRYLLLPEGLDADYITSEKTIRVRPDILSSRKSYSDFILDEKFYALFEEYEYLLIYQLDAFVFEDRLDYFCNLGLDYIGAEWLHGLECHCEKGNLWYFGNGGFSLRSVSAFRQWITENRELVNYARMLLPEDLAISIYGSEALKIADRDIAMQFSFDMHPEECFGICKNRLPFGCHAWDRFDRHFWKEIIDSYGYDADISEVIDEETKLLSSGKERGKELKKYFDSDKIEKCLQGLLDRWDGELYVFGAGQYGFSFINMVKNTDIRVINVIDNDFSKEGKLVEGIDIITLEQALEKKDAPILVCLANPAPVEKQLTEHGLNKGADYTLSVDLQNEMCRL